MPPVCAFEPHQTAQKEHRQGNVWIDAEQELMPGIHFRLLPGTAAAARADLVVCNGGSPTSYQALVQGTPVLGIPGNLDQYLNMHYLEKAGLGRCLRGTQLSAGTVADAAHRLLHDDAVNTATCGFAQRARAYDCTARLRDVLPRLV